MSERERGERLPQGSKLTHDGEGGFGEDADMRERREWARGPVIHEDTGLGDLRGNQG